MANNIGSTLGNQGAIVVVCRSGFSVSSYGTRVKIFMPISAKEVSISPFVVLWKIFLYN